MSKDKFDQEKELIKLKTALAKLKHDYHIEELTFSRENDKLHHEREMERQRIKSAEIRKSQERREWSKMHQETKY